MCKTFSTRPQSEPSKYIDCYVCGSSEKKKIWDIEGASYVKCRKCGLVYQYPQPVQEALIDRYDDSYFRYELENEENFFDLMIKGLEDIRFFKDIEPCIEKKSILDVGCATGRLLYFFKNRGWDAYGVEICPQSSGYARNKYGLKIFEKPVERLDIEDSSFGFIHSSHVIEHVSSPVDFLASVFRLLVPGGYSVIVTPNVKGLQAVIMQEKWRSAIPDHTFLFSKKTFFSLATQQGFEILGWKTWGGLAKGLAPDLLKNPVDKLAKIFGFGDVMLTLLRKPLSM